MTHNYHDPLQVAAAATASSFNQVFSDLDSGITGVANDIEAVQAVIGQSPAGHLYGFGVTVGAVYVTIAPGAARADDDTADIRRDSTITIDSAFNGVNGLDTGVLGVNAWYRVYVIYNETTGQVGGLMSVSNSPDMPNGYSHKRRVGWARTNSSGTLVRSGATGSGIERRVMWHEDTTTGVFQVWTASNIGETWTAQDCSAVVPPHATRIVVYHQRLATGGAIRIRTNANQVRNLSGGLAIAFVCEIDVANQAFEVIAVGAGAEGAHLQVHGYIDDLGVF